MLRQPAISGDNTLLWLRRRQPAAGSTALSDSCAGPDDIGPPRRRTEAVYWGFESTSYSAVVRYPVTLAPRLFWNPMMASRVSGPMIASIGPV